MAIAIAVIVALVLLLGTFVAALFLSNEPGPFPTMEEVDAAFAESEKVSDQYSQVAMRSTPLIILLQRLAVGPSSREESAVLEYAVGRFEELYTDTHEPVVAAVIVGGMAHGVCCEVQNGLCALYERLLHDPVFFEYIRNNEDAKGLLARCSSANFSAEEIESLVSGRVKSMQEFNEKYRSKPMTPEAPLPD